MIKKVISIALTLTMMLLLFAGCSQTPASTPEDPAPAPAQSDSGDAGDASAASGDAYKVAFACKFLTSVWFGPKGLAMEQRANELGMTYLGIDANNNEDAFMQGVQNAINQDVNGIILTPVNTAMLPAVVDLCKSAGVAYMTTDDPGVDSDGNAVPHLGLDDYALGQDSAEEMVKEAKARGFLDDPSKVSVVMIGVPAVEGFQKRVIGGYDVVSAAFPEIPEENYTWLDSKDGLVDNVVAQFSNTYQALAGKTEYWIILGGDEGAGAGTFPILEENGVDFSKVLLSTICGSDMLPVLMSESEDKANAIYFSGILPGPSGVALMDIMYDHFANGVPIPEFTGYPKNVVSKANLEEAFVQYLDS